jgi:hypothetical protein
MDLASCNLSVELIPDKIEDKWTAAELNNILLNNVVRGPQGSVVICTRLVASDKNATFSTRRDAQGARLSLQHRRPSFSG